MGSKPENIREKAEECQAMEGREHSAGLGAPVYWHLGTGPSVGLCGQSND